MTSTSFDEQLEPVAIDGGTGGGVVGRQPNFLQKLFDFLALNPRPYPDVIYWAADSKQLVIARPDELAKNVLPRLFKHDKVASFGRQLNIYGFSRVYPGRQFKDDSGNILDASVWAHPTLHRLSTSVEVASVKRRAAPKLFRTRRLASGQLIRTKAGPDIARKFREIKEDMAIERRQKHGWAEGMQSAPIIQQSPILSSNPSYDDHFQGELSGMSSSGCGSMYSGVSWEDVHTPISSASFEQQGAHHRQHDPFPASFDLRDVTDDCRQPLSSITEGQPTSQDLVYHTYSNPQSQQIFDTFSPIAPPPPPPRHANSFPPLSGPFYRSCPASIHTSPVPSAMVLNQVRQFPPSFSRPSLVSGIIHDTLESKVSTHIHVPARIAEPAAIDPFAVPHGHPYHDPHYRPTYASPIDHNLQAGLLQASASSTYQPRYVVSADTTPTEGMSREASMYPEGQSWERTGVIDPRWVMSPRGSANWNTPAQTPRCGSPSGAFQDYVAVHRQTQSLLDGGHPTQMSTEQCAYDMPIRKEVEGWAGSMIGLDGAATRHRNM